MTTPPNLSFTGTVFLTGGTGKVASRIARLCAAAGIPHIIASRNPPPSSSTDDPLSTHVRFDWNDRTTWAPALAAVPFPGAPPIRSIYLVVPGMADPDAVVGDFIEMARLHNPREYPQGQEKGSSEGGAGTGRTGTASTTTFVLQSSSQLPEGGPAMGQIHARLRRLADEGKLCHDGGWAVLRPSWFQENFAEGAHLQSLLLKEEEDLSSGSSKIYSAAADGRVPWVAADDIAAVGFHALTNSDKNTTKNEYLILGPELLSYDSIAATLSSVLGRPVSHVRLTVPQLSLRHQSTLGLSPEYADVLAGLDGIIAGGGEEKVATGEWESGGDDVELVTGRKGRGFREFVERNREVWR